ncbi:MAG: DUF885 domain-containing protein [Pyrinomonadaceae bacterium]|nr:DUF885 domain-containing protein [Pyrinomonadaceae bacterium]
MKHLKSIVVVFCTFALLAGTVFAQSSGQLTEFNEPPSQIRGMIEKYSADHGSLDRFYSAPGSKNRAKRFREFYSEWLARLGKLDFSKLNHDEQIDHLLFKNYLNHQLAELERAQAQIAEMSTLVPYADVINDLEDARRRLETTDAAKSAAILDDLDKKIAETRKKIDSGAVEKPKKTVANRAARYVDSLRRVLRNWFNFHKGYDPSFSWWNDAPYRSVDKNLENYQKFLLDKLVGIAPDDKTTIIGDPIGRDALIRELEYEMIPYSPDELVEIANKEFAWCEAEMKKASREMGFGDDWKAALEAVKNKYVEPGKQPELIRDQALKAIEFLEKNELISIPQLAKETWRMEMMSPERQLIAPFFLGGEAILVSYPTDTMTHEQKMMSMRGNNPHFTNAVVHHELIPGHHMQRFMNNRYRPYRQMFYTPFWMEGWALYWEFLLWDKNFNTTPEDKVGALFWRMHRAARIIFSLNFHLEKMTPAEAVDFLVNRVGHERENALGEVRRSFSGDYGPLYQIAYMMGGLQFKELHRELVGSKKMTDRQFHDAVLREGPVPVEMVRAILSKQRLSADLKTNWRFYPGLK